jgi:hypothetical protein
MGFKKTGHLKEQGTLGFTEKPVRASECVLLRNTGNGKGLAGKSRYQNIIGRNIFRTDLPDVPGKRVVSRKIGLVSFSGFSIPFTGEDAFPACCLESEPHPSNAGEKVNEPESRISVGFPDILFFRYFSQILKNGGLGSRFSLFPPNDSSMAIAKSGGYFPLGKV